MPTEPKNRESLEVQLARISDRLDRLATQLATVADRVERVERALAESALAAYPQLSETSPLQGSGHAVARVQRAAPALYAVTREVQGRWAEDRAGREAA